MGLAWTEHLSVGNEIIDSDHKKLIVMVDAAEDMINKRDVFALSQAFDQVEHWLGVNFSDEEKIAQAVKFPFTQHKLKHESMLKVLYFMRQVIAGKDGVWDEDTAENYAEILSDWLTAHILMEDMLMKPVLQNYPYDFKPAGWHAELV